MVDHPFEPPKDTPVRAMERLQNRLEAIHPDAATIITAHAALELEVDKQLKQFFARPDKLPRLSFEHQLGLLRAILDDEWFDKVLDAISLYGALRNSVAHGDSPDTVAKMVTRLGDKTREIDMPLRPDTNLVSLAMGLVAALHVGAEGVPGYMATRAPRRV
jgi:hypothetical protein